MKKTYINPELEVVKLQTMQMLAASITISEESISNPSEFDAPGMDFDFSDNDTFTFEEESFNFGE